MKDQIIIKIKGRLDESWKDWFDEMDIVNEKDITILSCAIKDKAFVHGILNKIRDLNLDLISVNVIPENQ